MAKRNNHTFKKQMKEIKRKKKAKEKLDRRQGKNTQDLNDDDEESDTNLSIPIVNLLKFSNFTELQIIRLDVPWNLLKITDSLPSPE